MLKCSNNTSFMLGGRRKNVSSARRIFVSNETINSFAKKDLSFVTKMYAMINYNKFIKVEF